MKSLVLVFYKEALNDLLHAKFIPLGYRFWAIRHGMNPTTAWFRRINNANIRDYLSEYKYYKCAPYNDRKVRGAVSKTNYRTTFKDFQEYLPVYYATLNQGEVEFLDGWPVAIEKNGTEAILKLLEDRQHLAIKLLNGRAGRGFIEAKYSSKFVFNNKEYNYEAAKNYLDSLNGYMVCEYIEQCEEYRKIWNGTSHTLRIQTCCLSGEDVKPVFSFLRIGSSKVPHAVSHIAEPGMFTGIIDISNGTTRAVITCDEHQQYKRIHAHPDSGEEMVIDVPNWNLIIDKCVELHKRVSGLRWLGWDIIVTDSGFKIIEVNTFSGLVGVEILDPIMSSDSLRPIFASLMNGRE